MLPSAIGRISAVACRNQLHHTAVADSPWISGMSHDKNVLRRGEDDSIGTAFAASMALGFGSPAPMQKS